MIKRQRSRALANYFTILCLFLGLLMTPSVSNAQITGTVFRDFNADGAQQSIAPTELGLSGVVVTAYDAAGTALGTATTASTGIYSFSVGTLASGMKVRLEFTLPTAYYASNAAVSNSIVQFITAGVGVTANLGVNAPADYCQANPNLVTPCYVNGDPQQTGTAGADPVLIRFPYTASGQAYAGGTPDVAVATGSQIGAVWALAYQKNTQQLFSAAFLKRHVGFGPLGIGGIYKTNMVTNATSNFIDVKTIGIDVGTNPHTGLTGNAADPTYDEISFGKVGKVGMGGMDMSDDGKYLFVVNLNLRTLNKIFVNNPSVTPTAANVNTYAIPSPGCRNGDFRPFAVKYYRGKVYVGVVCTNETAQDTVGMNATVYEFDPTTVTFTVVLQYPLTFRKGQTDDNPVPAINYWYAWSDNINKAFDYGFGQFYKYYPQYILSDIEFDVDGTMVVSGMDRFGHQLGWYNYLPDPTHTNTQTYETTGNAQVYRAGKCGGATTWTLENNASVCGAAPTLGANNNKGPGGGTFYYQNTYEPYHQELSYGGLTLLSGSNEIIETCLDPLNVYAGGVLHMNNSTGARGTAYEIYASPNNGGAAPFGKANGLGDLKALCNAQPIEIGHTVWNDANKNGIHDANELGIDGVIVELYDGATKVGTATTANGGAYVFNASNVTLNGATEIKPNTAYTIKIASAQFNNTGVASTPLSNLTLTTANATSTGLAGVADNDATIISGLATIAYTTNSAGENNQTLDFGFKAACQPIMLGPVPLPNGTVGTPYSVQITVTGGTAPYQFLWYAGTMGAIPLGLSINSTGLVSGTPTTAGSYGVKIVVKDANVCPDSIDPAAITIVAAPCTPPSVFSVFSQQSTCTNGVANNNAAIAVRGIVGMAKYAYRTNATDSLWANTATVSTADSIKISNIANPSVSTTYTFRMWGVDTTCYNDTTVVLTPKVCPTCAITATFTQETCNSNGTTAIATDDYFTVTVSNVTSTNGGTSGKYEMILNGSVLNSGGTAYGTPVTVGGILSFKSDGATTYNLTVRDVNILSCATTVFTTTPSVSCSVIGCKAVICLPVTVTKF